MIQTVKQACRFNPVIQDYLDGSNPKDGVSYEKPFEVGSQATRLLVYARAGEANKTADFQIPASGGDKTVQIVDAQPAKLTPKRVSLDSTDRLYGVINRFRDQPGTRFKGVRIEIGEDENTVTVCFQEREVTTSMIEGVVNNLRQVLNETQAPVAITITNGIQFDTGFAAKEFARLAGLELKRRDPDAMNQTRPRPAPDFSAPGKTLNARRWICLGTNEGGLKCGPRAVN